MKTTSTLVGVAAIAAGTVGAAWAYDAAAPPQETTHVAASTPAPAKVVAKRARLVLAPCRPPAELRKGACVTEVVRTVILPAPPAPAVPATSPVASAPVPSGPAAGNPPRTHGDDEAEDEAEHEDDAEHEDEGDHEDDEHEAPEPEGR